MHAFKILFLELGHNWGSLHDNDADGCGTQYLMQKVARTGGHPNNFVRLNFVKSLPNYWHLLLVVFQL